jgi:hypothetical protein
MHCHAWFCLQPALKAITCPQHLTPCSKFQLFLQKGPHSWAAKSRPHRATPTSLTHAFAHAFVFKIVHKQSVPNLCQALPRGTEKEWMDGAWSVRWFLEPDCTHSLSDPSVYDAFIILVTQAGDLLWTSASSPPPMASSGQRSSSFPQKTPSSPFTDQCSSSCLPSRFLPPSTTFMSHCQMGERP